jgi:hypothetical protein
METNSDISGTCGCDLCRHRDRRAGAGQSPAGGHRRVGWAAGSPFADISGAVAGHESIPGDDTVTIGIGDIIESRHRAAVVIGVAFAISLIVSFAVAVTFI